jgi:hypothetical protein
MKPYTNHYLNPLHVDDPQRDPFSVPADHLGADSTASHRPRSPIAFFMKASVLQSGVQEKGQKPPMMVGPVLGLFGAVVGAVASPWTPPSVNSPDLIPFLRDTSMPKLAYSTWMVRIACCFSTGLFFNRPPPGLSPPPIPGNGMTLSLSLSLSLALSLSLCVTPFTPPPPRMLGLFHVHVAGVVYGWGAERDHLS